MKRSASNAVSSTGAILLALLGMAGCLAFVPVDAVAATPDLPKAAQAVAEGVPEVAVTRLREMLKNTAREEEWRAIAMQLAPALLAAHAPEQALALLDDPRLKGAPSWNLWRGQALAALHRWNEALRFFQTAA